MIKNTMKSILDAARSLFKTWASLAIFAGLYALLLATLYGFIATREATVTQVLLTLLFAASAPVIFFLLQATIINRARTGRINWYRALRDSCKFAVIALPVILAGLMLASLLNRWQAHFPAPHVTQAAWQLTGAQPVPPPAGRAVIPQPIHKPTFIFGTLRLLLFGLALPLTLIQLWVEVDRRDWLKLIRIAGVRANLSRLAHLFARAFAPKSVLTYALGLVVFAVLPYVFLFAHVPFKGMRTEIAVFVTRLALTFVCTLFGWVITLSTFAQRGRHRPLASREQQPQESA
jgi:hypothetical protein